jgi:hypothetical protein
MNIFSHAFGLLIGVLPEIQEICWQFSKSELLTSISKLAVTFIYYYAGLCWHLLCGQVVSCSSIPTGISHQTCVQASPFSVFLKTCFKTHAQPNMFVGTGCPPQYPVGSYIYSRMSTPTRNGTLSQLPMLWRGSLLTWTTWTLYSHAQRPERILWTMWDYAQDTLAIWMQ